jgi:hypothetical protein
MPNVLKEDLRESGALVILEFAKSKYPEYTNSQLSSLFKRASAKIRKIHLKKEVDATVETTTV